MNRDRHDPSAVLAITTEKVTDYLSSVGYISSTIMPEMTKYTEDNRIGSYTKPIDVCVANHGFILSRFAFDQENGTSLLLRARLHPPVDQITFLYGNSTEISIVELCYESLSLIAEKNRTKEAFKNQV